MGFFITLLVYGALFVISDLLRPKPELENAKPVGLGDFRFPTATEDRPIPMLWGTVRIEGPNVVWWGDLVQEAITEKVKTGLFSSETLTKGYRYRVGIQQVLCLGADDSAAERVKLLRVWIGDDLVVDATSSPIEHGDTFDIDEPELFGGEELGAGGIVGTLEFFAGTNTQAASDYLSGTAVDSATVSAGGSGYAVNDILTENGSGTASTRATFRVTGVTAGAVDTVQRIDGGTYTVQSSSPAATTSSGAGTGCTLSLTYGTGFQAVGGVAPAYRDVCYIAPAADPVLVGTSTSIKPWKFEAQRLPDGLALAAGREEIDGGANPANVLYEILTNDDWGYGIPSAEIDTTDFSTAAATLATEGNGFSFLLDRTEQLPALVRRLEEQIDGILYVDPLDGLWKIALIRADYVLASVPEVNATNMRELRQFNRGTWEGTSNAVRVPFNDAADDYKGTSGFAQDMANVRILGANVTSEVRHPGVKTASLANAIAWRELRTLSIPLANAEFVVDRSLYGVKPGDVVAFTDEDIGYDRLPMRVKSVDYGDLLDGRIVLECVQDVFFAAAGTFGDPPPSSWEPPSATLVDYPADEKVVIEAPRALTLRDPNSASPYVDKVFAAARRQGSEVTFQLWQRNDPSTPSGAYAEFGEVFQFQLIGVLSSALNVSSVNPVTSVQVIPVPDTQAAILASLLEVVDVVELGTELVNLLLIGDEFVIASSSQANAGNVQLNSVYRGVLDSVQADHAAGTPVYVLHAGAGLSDDSLPAGNVVDVKLLPRAAGEALAIGDATETQIELANRTRRPYPPSSFDLNSVALPSTNVDLDGSGSGEDVGVLCDDIIRRDFRTVDEIAALSTDAASLFSDFPTENTTTLDFRVRTTGGTLVFEATAESGTSYTFRQLDILAGLDTPSLPSSLVFSVGARHVFEGTTYTSLQELAVTPTILSDLVGAFAFGELDQSDVSAAYTVDGGDGSTDHDFTLSTAFTAGDVEYRINGGSWTTLIASGNTSGSIPNASIADGDTIETRHGSTDVDPQKLLRMTVGATLKAYGVLIS